MKSRMWSDAWCSIGIPAAILTLISCLIDGGEGLFLTTVFWVTFMAISRVIFLEARVAQEIARHPEFKKKLYKAGFGQNALFSLKVLALVAVVLAGIYFPFFVLGHFPKIKTLGLIGLSMFRLCLLCTLGIFYLILRTITPQVKKIAS